ncbi:uncharacterized protein BXIN_0340 [Babesia sp. Xinjiang]|uniref:uncharacterized protein n=1 Tax=Babesia sp. Xinjiang TaxID=462227 RepID=UPI000A263DD1|nr:uncharacterized protein BXIN_0340 [Babesia sp. Xinjiang]ORM41212.1 hypothetical protein BXIN_0340 [Babesia sp. Xinjiang]
MWQPRGFHRGSTVIMSGFDPQFSADDCRAFASWFSPVVYVEQLSTNNDKSRFMVVFASNAHVEVCFAHVGCVISAQQLARHREISVDNGIIEVKAVGTDESVWNTMGDMMTYTSAAPILQMAQDGLNAALNQLSFGWGGYLTG